MGSPWLLWRYFVKGKNRRGWNQKLFGAVDVRQSNQPCIWFHAVSVGEVNLLAPVIERLNQIQPTREFVISTTTETGFDLANKKYPGHYVFFCPFDFTWAIKRVLKRLKPDALVLAELELWPNLIQTTRQAGIPVSVINGRLSESSHRGYRKFRWLVTPILKQLSWIGAQDQTSADRFRDLGCDPTQLDITGNIKFDGVVTDRNNEGTMRLRSLAKLTPDHFVWVAGSTQLEEDLLIAQTYQRLARTIPELRLILVPRHPERTSQLVAQLAELDIPCQLRSSLPDDQQQSVAPEHRHGNHAGTPDASYPILIVDVIGELGGWWGLANIAYVGGSMGQRGGQNMIEPAAYGVPISFGPNTSNFREIVAEFLAHDAATVVHDAATIEAFVLKYHEDNDWGLKSGARAQSVVLSHSGATQTTVERLCRTMVDPQR